jgi:hypothetical protein
MTALGNTRLTAPQRSLADLASRTVDQAAGLIEARLKRMRYRPTCSPASPPGPGLAFNPP